MVLKFRSIDKGVKKLGLILCKWISLGWIKSLVYKSVYKVWMKVFKLLILGVFKIIMLIFL